MQTVAFSNQQPTLFLSLLVFVVVRKGMGGYMQTANFRIPNTGFIWIWTPPFPAQIQSF